ncbi:MAG: PEP-CTERM sorting domain-containing protein [Kiritimatiellaceae bacterium]|nr:PEP-CTERM sorting domain-containing protein [Kiritimatiellaceae bacterium]
MEIKRLYYILALNATVFSGYAEVVNGSVDSPTIYDANSISVSSDLDQGWHARSASFYDLSINDIWFGGLTYQPGYWFGQIYTDNSATTNTIELSFDVTYMGANIQTPKLQYTIFGANVTDISQTALALNVDDAPAGSAWTLIGNGSVTTPSIGSYATEVDFGAEGYKYIGVRFRFSGTTKGRGIDYATAVDNISLAPNSVIPEPAVIGLLGIGGIVTLVARRIARK